ncbi:hypothetical protein RKD19_007374 [Streptomyces canus]|nr:hypothetical protein [Streptomyces sp. RP5T]
MIVWSNGAFGSGRTTLPEELRTPPWLRPREPAGQVLARVG